MPDEEVTLPDGRKITVKEGQKVIVMGPARPTTWWKMLLSIAIPVAVILLILWLATRGLNL